MIQVQIASQITAQGVRGVRWVLLEAVDAQQAVQPAPALALAAQHPDPAVPDARGAPVADSLRLGALKAAAIGLGLGAALWTAAVQVGAPARPGPAAAAAPAGPPGPPAQSAAPPQRLPMHTAPAVQPRPGAGGLHAPGVQPAAPPQPAASATTTGLPRLTAAL